MSIRRNIIALIGDVGETTAGFVSSSETVHIMQPGCSIGSFSGNFTSQPCEQCPLGSYSGAQGMTSCTACPPFTTTPFIGATDKQFCSRCVSNLCVHGVCSVDGEYNAVCTCSFGFAGSNCDTNVLAIVLGSILAGLLVVGLTAFGWLRLRRRLFRVSHDLSLKEQLLNNTSIELEALERVLHIQPKELSLIKLVDAGSFGEVWVGEYQVSNIALRL